MSRLLRLSHLRELAFWSEFTAEPGTPERQIRAARYGRIVQAYHAERRAQGVAA